jgi:trimethylamine--corrinoid protein Co-methyltransferase
MKTTQVIFGGPEQGLTAVAQTQIGKYYGLPVYTNVGLTDSKTVDAQAGMEISTTLLMGALAGSDIFGHFGIIGADQGGNLEMLLFQHEAIEFIERILRSFEVNDEFLGLDVIAEVGPGGTFIDQVHTAQHYRSQLWMPNILDRQFWSSWEQEGRKSIADRLPGHVEELLKSYEEKPLEDALDKEVTRIVSAARRLGS